MSGGVYSKEERFCYPLYSPSPRRKRNGRKQKSKPKKKGLLLTVGDTVVQEFPLLGKKKGERRRGSGQPI